MYDVAARKIQLWNAAMSADPDLYEVAARVSTIPDTATAVLRFANSAYIGAVYPVGTVLEAVIRVGSRSVGALAMASLNRDLVDTWGAPELWEGSLVVGRAAKLIGRLLGFSRSQNEHLFVAGLFSCAGSAGLLMKDEGYLDWRHRQWMKGASDAQMLERERMVYGSSHVEMAAGLLREWNLPDAIVGAVAAHHSPHEDLEKALWAAMMVLPAESPGRCLDLPFKNAVRALGLEEHREFVETEAKLFADVTVDAFTRDQAPKLKVVGSD